MSTTRFCLSPFSTGHNRGNLSAGKCAPPPQAHRHESRTTTKKRPASGKLTQEEKKYSPDYSGRRIFTLEKFPELVGRKKGQATRCRAG